MWLMTWSYHLGCCNLGCLLPLVVRGSPRRLTRCVPPANMHGTAPLTPLGCSHSGQRPAPPSLPRRIALSPFVWRCMLHRRADSHRLAAVAVWTVAWGMSCYPPSWYVLACCVDSRSRFEQSHARTPLPPLSPWPSGRLLQIRHGSSPLFQIEHVSDFAR